MEEKKEFKMHELGASDACNKRRNFGLIVNSAKENSYKKAIVIQDVLKKIIFDGITESEAETEIRKGLEKLPYHEREREAHIRDAVREIYRYVDYEKGPLTAAVPADIEVGANMIVKVTPTFIKAKAEMRFIFVSEGRKKAKDIQIDGSIEVIKVKTGKPKDIRKADTDIGLWSMILYGRKFVRPGQKVVIKASYYYLRRSDDSFQKGIFEEFEEDKNVVSISELYEGKPNYMDERFAIVTEDFMNGQDETYCRNSDCEKCSYFVMCKGYVESPKATGDGIITRSASDVAFTASQSEAIEY